MDVIIKNGDTVPIGNGDLAKVTGAEAIFQRGEILMKMKRGRFYLDPEMGAALSGKKLCDPERIEMLLNEAITPVEGLTARVMDIKDGSIKVKLFYKNSEKECEVIPDEYI